ncbi:MAG: L-threonylcarbamoyladenylate synthase [Bacteroidota bacterium]
MAEIGKDIEKAAVLLASGELVAIPTETVYGLGGNAFDADAVLKIFETKGRPQFNPLIVHTDRVEKISSFIQDMPEEARILAEKFWPGPLTLLLPRNEIIPDLVTAGNTRVAIRIPDHPLTLQLFAQLSFPVAAPSANPFGYISPTKPAHVADQLGDLIPYILDGGACRVGVESTILGFDEFGRPEIHRFGGISQEAIEAEIGSVRIHEDIMPLRPQASGALRSHYAPRTPMILGDIESLLEKLGGSEVGVLSFSRRYAEVPDTQQQVLSEVGDLREAAQGLFGAMRYLDGLNLKLILAERLPDHGLGRAINDRLKRAAE